MIPDFGHRVGGMRLDLEPDAVFRFRRPDRRHGLSGVTGNHVDFVMETALMACPGRRSRRI